MKNAKDTLLSLCFKLKWKTGIGYNKKVSNWIDLALQQVWCNSKLISCDKLQVWIGITSIAVFGKKRPCDQKCAYHNTNQDFRTTWFEILFPNTSVYISVIFWVFSYPIVSFLKGEKNLVSHTNSSFYT